VPAIFEVLYSYAWFVGLFIAGGLYLLLASARQPARNAG